jgi:hypothetical protein
LEGFWLHLVAMGVPHERTDRLTPAERQRWVSTRASNRASAATGLTVEESLKVLHDPRWSWRPDFYKDVL